MNPIHVDRDGRWDWEGRPMLHEGILRYLKQNLEQDTDGGWWVTVGPSRVPVIVEDAPFLVEALLADPPRLRLDDGSEEPLPAPFALVQDAEHRLHTRARGGKYRALLSRAAHHQVWGALEEDAGGRRWLVLGATSVPVELS